ncbi:wiskott-Aldrich syndrome protein family member 3-like [Pseudonaja textilis]|uniref:wiskott-Aldrich syndrome protein family member 3-like n=1 Tax=Pseudonaja textilis TaxID=8673 RepID=UPI000EA9FEAA|nr:wiskott-Aldrich syndrome protein family member 3-like [Pseudonaja textilis]
MPLVKRNIEPRHLCRGALPDGVTSELECVTNSTLAAIIKQLGSLSKDDKKDGLKFYTDPSYFFNLWKEKMLQATEDKRKEKRRQKEQRLVEDSTREVKKVRKARNRRLEWNMMAYDKEFRPDNRFSPSPYHMASSEGSLSPDNRSYASDVADHSYPASPNHPGQQMMAPATHLAPENKEVVLVATQVQDQIFRPSAVGSRQNSLNRVQQPHVPQPSETMLNGPRPQIIKDYGPQPVPMADYFVPPAPPPPPPVIPSAQTAFDSPISAPSAMAPNAAPSVSHATYAPTPPPAMPCPYSASPPQAGPMGPPVAPPPPPPGPPTISASPAHSASPPALTVDSRKQQPPVPLIPMTDARSDLLAAIRRGIQLRKVQEQWEQEAKKEPVGNDVATILSRRIAVEYSESDDDSELDENEWSD